MDVCRLVDAAKMLIVMVKVTMMKIKLTNLVTTLGKWQRKNMTTVEMRIIARLQSLDCWVARRSRSFSEDFYYPLMEDDNEDNPQENSWEEVLFPDKV